MEQKGAYWKLYTRQFKEEVEAEALGA